MDREVERPPQIDEIWMLARIENSFNNEWFSKPKFEKIVTKNVAKNDVYVDFGRV